MLWTPPEQGTRRKRRERQARDKAVSDAKKIQKTAPEHRWGGRTIFAMVVRERAKQ
jgi:hypothetical protein